MKRCLVGLALFSLMMLAGCGANGSRGADFLILEITNDPSLVTLRIEVSQDTDETTLKNWADKNAKAYGAHYGKPVTMHFYRGGHGPEYYIAIYNNEQFIMLR